MFLGDLRIDYVISIKQTYVEIGVDDEEIKGLSESKPGYICLWSWFKLCKFKFLPVAIMSD